MVALLSLHHEDVPIRIVQPRCQVWSCWGSSDHQHRFSGSPCPRVFFPRPLHNIRRFSAPTGIHRCSRSFQQTGPLEFQLGVICIMVSEQANCSKLLQTAPALCPSLSHVHVCMQCVRRTCFGNVCVPRKSGVSLSPTIDDLHLRQSRNCLSVVLAVLEVLVLPSLLVHLGQDCLSNHVVLRSLSALLFFIGSPAHVQFCTAKLQPGLYQAKSDIAGQHP